jgi:hypothetical protein
MIIELTCTVAYRLICCGIYGVKYAINSWHNDSAFEFASYLMFLRRGWR